MDTGQDTTQDLLDELLAGKCADELAATYKQIAATFQEAGYTGHIDELDLMTGQLLNNKLDPLTVVSEVEEVLRIAADKCLGLLLVQLDDNIDIEMLAEALDILLTFDPTDTPEILLNSINNADTTEESLGKLLATQGTYPEDDWFTVIVSVEPSLMSRITTGLQRSIESSGVNALPVGSPELLQRIARLNKIQPTSLGAELASANTGVGISLESLYAIHVGNLLELDMEAAITNIYSLAALGEESLEHAQSSISHVIDDFCGDVDVRRKAEQIRLSVHATFLPIFGGNNEQ